MLHASKSKELTLFPVKLPNCIQCDILLHDLTGCSWNCKGKYWLCKCFNFVNVSLSNFLHFLWLNQLHLLWKKIAKHIKWVHKFLWQIRPWIVQKRTTNCNKQIPFGQILQPKQQSPGQSVTKESCGVTSVLAAVPAEGAQRDPSGWMDPYSDAPGVSTNGL